MPKATKKVGGLFRRFIWQPLPWFAKLLAPIALLALAVQLVASLVEWVMR